METALEANGKYVILYKEEPHMDDIKKALLLSADELNPSILYGKVISTGDECRYNYDEDFVYVNKLNALKLNHNGEEYYIVREDDIFATATEV